MQGAMPISMATVGTAYTIKKISGNTEVRSHLKSMGFNEGTEVKLITQLDGDVIIHVKESRGKTHSGLRQGNGDIPEQVVWYKSRRNPE